jgi:hypothetical protein
VSTVANVLVLLAVVVLGLSAGAVLAEGAVLVPYWRSLPPASFLAWYRDNGKLLLRFFGPLEVVAAVLAMLAAFMSWTPGNPAALPLKISALLAVLVLAAFPMYFQRVNASFAGGTIEADKVAEELRRWARWHWARVVVATAAFVVAASALSLTPR